MNGYYTFPPIFSELALTAIMETAMNATDDWGNGNFEFEGAFEIMSAAPDKAPFLGFKYNPAPGVAISCNMPLSRKVDYMVDETSVYIGGCANMGLAGDLFRFTLSTHRNSPGVVYVGATRVKLT